MARGRPSSRAHSPATAPAFSCRQREGRRPRARPLDEQGDGRHRRQLGQRREVVGVRHGQRADGQGALPAQAERLAGRRQHRHPRARAQEAAHVPGGAGQVLEVVQHQQQAGRARAPPGAPPGRCAPPSTGTPRARAMADGTAAGSGSGARSTNRTPSGNAGSSRRESATATARRVLPTPPGPTRVRRRPPAASTCPRAVSSSAARPMSAVACGGSCPGPAAAGAGPVACACRVVIPSATSPPDSPSVLRRRPGSPERTCSPAPPRERAARTEAPGVPRSSHALHGTRRVWPRRSYPIG